MWASIFGTCQAPRLPELSADGEGPVTNKIVDIHEERTAVTNNEPEGEPHVDSTVTSKTVTKTTVNPKQFAVDVLAQGGHRFRQHCQRDKALLAYKSVLAQQPANEEALIGQVLALYGLGNHGKANEVCIAALSTLPSCDRLRQLKTDLDNKVGIETCDPAKVTTVAAWPPCPPAPAPGAAPFAIDATDFSFSLILQGAHWYFEQDEFKKALMAYVSALAQKSTSEEALCGRVHALRSLGKTSEAEAACRAGLALLPESSLLQSVRDSSCPPSSADPNVGADPKLAQDKSPLLAATKDEREVVDVKREAPKTTAKTPAPKKAPLKEVPLEAGLHLTDKKIVPKAKLSPLQQANERLQNAPVVEATCPASRSEDDYKKELQLIRKKNKKVKSDFDMKNGDKPMMKANLFEGTFIGKQLRETKKTQFQMFYKEQYARLASVSTKQYQDSQLDQLSIKGGHQPMPRPDPSTVKLPEDHMKPVGVLTTEQLLRYDCFNPRMLMSVHGDIFDISDRPDKYDTEGPYWAMAGHDITWGLVCGNDGEAEFDKYYDVFKAPGGEDAADRNMQGLMSWWAFYQREYGDPVGRLKPYEEEHLLPPVPDMSENCSIM
eukprot:TRINITY_DN27716_c0_g1_i1.p1 TRINITY_DN27716_c0_g1~~TRINITY_DN27716_c0_g1_i1.p1  ORF type:complete len:606 (+),score=115.75 TRINITY_DN27716_c0_g1_i1:126-1943(+)